MTDLDKLIEAVECDNGKGKWAKLCKPLEIDPLDVMRAHHGSLDASKSLHEALISSCQANIELSGEVWVLGDETAWNYVEARVYANPARAWLLGILKAYRSMM